MPLWYITLERCHAVIIPRLSDVTVLILDWFVKYHLCQYIATG